MEITKDDLTARLRYISQIVIFPKYHYLCALFKYTFR
jgi:hypothetical protein